MNFTIFLYVIQAIVTDSWPLMVVNWFPMKLRDGKAYDRFLVFFQTEEKTDPHLWTVYNHTAVAEAFPAHGLTHPASRVHGSGALVSSASLFFRRKRAMVW